MAEVVASSGRLDDLARNIKAEWEKGRAAYADAMDCYLSIGHQLRVARKLLPEDKEFGKWFKAQHFEFTPARGLTLRLASENEPAVRDVVASQLATGRVANIEKAVKAVKPHRVVEVEPAAGQDVQEATNERDTHDDNRSTGEGGESAGGLSATHGLGSGRTPGWGVGPDRGGASGRPADSEPAVGTEATGQDVGNGEKNATGDSGRAGRTASPAPAPSPDEDVGEGTDRGNVAAPVLDDAGLGTRAPLPGEGSSSQSSASPSPTISPVATAGTGKAGSSPPGGGEPAENAPGEWHEYTPEVRGHGADPSTDCWRVEVTGTDPEGFAEFCSRMDRVTETWKVKWKVVGEVGEGLFSVDIT